MDKKYNELTEKDYEHKVDTVDGEEIYFKTAVSASIPQDFINLDTSQKSFIKHFLEGADTLIRKYQPNSTIDNYTPQTLDNIIDLWNADSTKFTCSENYFVNTVGAAFGQFLVKTYKMKWTTGKVTPLLISKFRSQLRGSLGPIVSVSYPSL